MAKSLKMGHKIDVHLSLDASVIEAIDQHRGSSQTRSEYINDVLWYTDLATDEEIARIDNY
jgi:hypothetical protein